MNATPRVFIDEILDQMPLLDADIKDCAVKYTHRTVLRCPSKPLPDSEDIEKSATKTDREEVRRTRSAYKNGLEFVGKMLMKRELWQLSVKIGAVSRFVY